MFTRELNLETSFIQMLSAGEKGVRHEKSITFPSVCFRAPIFTALFLVIDLNGYLFLSSTSILHSLTLASPQGT